MSIDIPIYTYIQVHIHNTKQFTSAPTVLISREIVNINRNERDLFPTTNLCTMVYIKRLTDINLIVAEDVFLRMQQHVGFPSVQGRDVIKVKASLCKFFTVIIIDRLIQI